MGIGNIGWTEFLFILAIALIFFGPRRLPGIAQAIGRSLREFQKALNEVKSEIAQAGREADVRTGAPYTPRDPLNLMAGWDDTAPPERSASAKPPPASAKPPTTTATDAPAGNDVDQAPGGAGDAADVDEAQERNDGDAGDKDER